MSDEVLRVDRHCCPQEGASSNPVLLARKHGGATTKRVDLYFGRNLPAVSLLDPTCYRHHTTPPASPH
jgi:hypothetical protein